MRPTRSGSGATARIEDLSLDTVSERKVRRADSGTLALNVEKGGHGLTLRLLKRGGSGAKAVHSE